MDRTIVITGGSGAIGTLLVERFLELGDRVFVTTGRAASLEDLRERVRASRDQLTGIACDLEDPDSVSAVVVALPDDDSRSLVLINNARTRTTLRVGSEGAVARSDFMQEYLLDVIVPYELTLAISKHFGPRLGNVVNVGSQYGTVASNPALYGAGEQAGFVHYNVAKAALHHLTRELAVRLGEHGTRVNAVAYGGLQGRVDGAFPQRYAAMVPSGRMLRPADIPGPVTFLASEDASGVNGHVLAADGGWTIW